MVDHMTDKPIRQITDSRVLAAMAHPLRRRLMDVLLVDGPATASLLAERTDQAVGNISHHLKALAAAELVQEAPELARDRRERWWRLVPETLRWSSTDFGGDPATEAIERAATSINLEREMGHVRAWSAAGQEEKEWWGEGPFITASWLRLSPDELMQLSAELIAVTTRWRDRDIPDDGAERRPVITFAHGVPGRP